MKEITPSPWRNEFKYLVRHEQALNFLQSTRSFLKKDSHCANGPYWCNSLYYDSPKREFFHQALESEEHRRKLRLRFYSGDLNQMPAILEIKEKTGNQGCKWRLPLERNLVEALKTLHFDLRKLSYQKSVNIPPPFDSLLNRYNLETAVWVSYQRDAYASLLLEEGLRITWDRNLFSRRPVDSNLRIERGWPVLRDPISLIEVKCSGRIPLWLHRALMSHEMVQTKYSKYTYSLDKLSLLDRKVRAIG